MVNRRALESLDRTFKDIMEVNLPFGGKVLILGGDFRQVLPVVPKGGLPPHILRLKKDPKAGLCNGTRLICRGCFNNVIDAEILIGQYAGTRVFLPRIPLKTTENVHLPFVMIRRHGQLYVALSRGVSQSTTKLLVQKGTIPEEKGVHTRNIVYKDVLFPSS
ncbi:hypothetical protein ACB092_06G100700 [Castanea dentata]